MKPQHLIVGTALVILAASCGSTTTVTTREDPNSVVQPVEEDLIPEPWVGVCPAPDLPMDLRTCEGLPSEYGFVMEQPLEWGGGAQRTLWYGRLMCPNGATPDVHRVGSFGDAPVSSTSPDSGKALMPGMNVLDGWSVRCPGQEEQLWYTSLYKCGNPCPPAGMGVVKVEAFALYAEAGELIRGLRQSPDPQADLVEILRISEEALALEPTSNLLMRRLGYVLMWSQRYPEAEAMFSKALEADPDDHYASISVGTTRQQNEDHQGALEALDATSAAMPEQHELRSELHCRKAVSLQALGRQAEAFEQAKLATQVGDWCQDLLLELTHP